MIDLAESDLMMNCVTHEMWFAPTVEHRLVLTHEKLIVESAQLEKFNSNPENKTTKWFFN